MQVYDASIEKLFKMEMPIKWNIKIITYLTQRSKPMNNDVHASVGYKRGSYFLAC